MAYDVQIRPELIKAGYTDADVGYDPTRKMTTLRGQDFLGAGDYTNVAGSTFTDRQKFDTALNKYKQGQQPITQMSGASTVGTQPTPSTDQRYIDLLNTVYQQAQAPQQVDANAIYGSPQYAAAQGQINRQVAEGQRQSREGLNRRGLFDSSLTSSQANQIAQEGTEYLNLQVLPQLIAQEEARRRQQTQDQFKALDVLTRERESARQFGLQEAGLTGKVYSDQERAARPLLNQLISLGEAWPRGTPEQKATYSQQADAIRAQLTQMNIDPSLYDPNLSTEQRRAAEQELGTPTLVAQEYEAKAREAEAKIKTDAEKAAFDSLWKAAEQVGTLPDELADFYGLPRGTKTLEAERVGISRINAQTSQANAGTSANQAALDQFLSLWKYQGRAPYDFTVNGVKIKQDTPYYDAVAARQDNQLDPKESTDNYWDLINEVDTATNPVTGQKLTKEEKIKVVQNNRNNLSDADYSKALQYVRQGY